MRVEINKSEELKKERKFQFIIYPESERDVEICREINTSMALGNLDPHKGNYLMMAFLEYGKEKILGEISKPVEVGRIK